MQVYSAQAELAQETRWIADNSSPVAPLGSAVAVGLTPHNLREVCHKVHPMYYPPWIVVGQYANVKISKLGM